jgi:hypothetical protein
LCCCICGCIVGIILCWFIVARSVVFIVFILRSMVVEVAI